MTIGIYCIRNSVDGKRYVGKSINIEKRFASHKYYNTRAERNGNLTNRYLYSSVQKHGWSSFITEVLETFESVDELLIAERELYWMDHFDTTNRDKGYNLRRDSSTGMIVHAETLQLKSETQRGSDNNNFGTVWTPDMKSKMSDIKKQQHAEGVIYDEDWCKKQGETSREFWKNNPEVKSEMAVKVKKKKQKYDFHQLTEEGVVVKVWSSMDDIIEANPEYKWQNIYSVCNGYKKRIYGFKWKKELKNESKT